MKVKAPKVEYVSTTKPGDKKGSPRATRACPVDPHRPTPHSSRNPKDIEH